MEPDQLRHLLEATRNDAADQGLSEIEALELRELLADDPQLQAELSRIGAWDQVLTSAIDDVPVPDGLAARLRATVAAELAVQPAAAATATAPPASRPARRRLMATLLATAAVLAMAIGLGTYWNQPAVVDVAALQQESLDLTRDLKAVAWQPATAAYPAAAFPTEIRFKPRRWGHVAASLDRQAIVFDLAAAGKPTAAVIAMQSSAASEELRSRPDSQPEPMTGNVCVSSWKQESYIYTLVVSGGTTRYQLFLRDSGSLTANWSSSASSR